MAHWIKNQCDVYNYRSYSFRLSTIKSWLNLQTENKDNSKHNLIEEHNYNKLKNSSITCKKCDQTEKNNNNKCNQMNHSRLLRRFSLQSYKKRKQQKDEEKSKPRIAAVLRTYDKRGLQKDGSDWL